MRGFAAEDLATDPGEKRCLATAARNHDAVDTQQENELFFRQRERAQKVLNDARKNFRTMRWEWEEAFWESIIQACEEAQKKSCHGAVFRTLKKRRRRGSKVLKEIEHFTLQGSADHFASVPCNEDAASSHPERFLDLREDEVLGATSPPPSRAGEKGMVAN